MIVFLLRALDIFGERDYVGKYWNAGRCSSGISPHGDHCESRRRKEPWLMKQAANKCRRLQKSSGGWWWGGERWWWWGWLIWAEERTEHITGRHEETHSLCRVAFLMTVQQLNSVSRTLTPYGRRERESVWENWQRNQYIKEERKKITQIKENAGYSESILLSFAVKLCFNMLLLTYKAAYYRVVKLNV